MGAKQSNSSHTIGGSNPPPPAPALRKGDALDETISVSALVSNHYFLVDFAWQYFDS